MKKNFLSIAIVAVVVSMSSCGGGSSFEGDVKKFANMRCKAQQLAAKDQSDEKVKKEMEELQKATSRSLCEIRPEGAPFFLPPDSGPYSWKDSFPKP